MIEYAATGSPAMEMDEAPPHDDASDSDIPRLLRRMKDGSEAAWEEFHASYFGFVFRSAASLNRGDDALAGEITQQTFLRVVRHLRPLPDEEALKRWLHCVVRSVSADLARGNSRRLAMIERYALWREIHFPDPIALHLQLDRREQAEKLLATLPPTERRLLHDFYLLGRSHRDIASDHDLSPKAVESRLARIRNRLRSSFAHRSKHAS